MKILVQRFEERDGDYLPGSVRIAVVTEEPAGKCSICKCPLYASITWEPSGTQVFTNDLGRHKKGCKNRPRATVVTRTKGSRAPGADREGARAEDHPRGRLQGEGMSGTLIGPSLLREILQLLDDREWLTRNSAENIYCASCVTVHERWKDQRHHHEGCRFVAVRDELAKALKEFES